MDVLAQLVVWLNAAANAAGRAFDFIAYLPGWLSATLIAVASGIAMLVVFKHTSNQRAIKRARQAIRANLLAVKLFYDNRLLGLRALGGVFLGALRLLVFAIVPILVMLVPVTLLLGQLALWYQARPLHIGEETAITLKLHDGSEWPTARLESGDAIKDTHGPVRVLSQREICWNIRAEKDGYQRLVFHVGDQTIEKDLTVGSGLMRVSTRRPDWDWSEALLNPAERPFPPNSPVQSIAVEYPTRASWIYGTNRWIWYWFVVSLVTGFCLRGVFKVSL
jgi:hypothetical protein